MKGVSGVCRTAVFHKGMKDSEESGRQGEVSEGAGTISPAANERVAPAPAARGSIGDGDAIPGTSRDLQNIQQQPSTSQAAVERQNSTSSTRSESEQRERRFPFLDFDSGAAPRALTMIQEWARNSVGANIPLLTSAAGSGAGGADQPLMNERERSRSIQLQRAPGDAPVTIPIVGESPPPAVNRAFNFPRIARGFIRSSARFVTRRSEESPISPEPGA